MPTITAFFDWIKTNPIYAVIPGPLILAFIVLAWETAKTLLPKGLEKLANALVRQTTVSNQRAKAEAAMRNLCLVSRDRNWANSLPAVSRHSLDIPLSEIFVLPHLATGGGISRGVPRKSTKFSRTIAFYV